MIEQMIDSYQHAQQEQGEADAQHRQQRSSPIPQGILERKWEILPQHLYLSPRRNSHSKYIYPTCLNASVMGTREACQAGIAELIKPMVSATSRLMARTTGGIVKPPNIIWIPLSPKHTT